MTPSQLLADMTRLNEQFAILNEHVRLQNLNQHNNPSAVHNDNNQKSQVQRFDNDVHIAGMRVATHINQATAQTAAEALQASALYLDATLEELSDHFGDAFMRQVTKCPAEWRMEDGEPLAKRQKRR
ncbi:hypothetical protein Q7P37_004453 [Cladosporium fusiforme]